MIYPHLPLKALSIIQPWPTLIVLGMKDIENRDWSTNYRGPVAVHAGKKLDESCAISLDRGYHPVSNRRVRYVSETQTYPRGGIVGVVDIVDCVEVSDSEWFVGRYGFVLANPKPVEFIPVKGALGFFDWRKNLEAA